MGLQSSFEVNGLLDVQRRVAQLGLNAKDLRRPNGFIGAEVVKRNRERLGSGVDVNSRPLQSKLSQKLGLVAMGGAHGLFGRSIKWGLAGGDLELFSTFIGAGVAYRGDTITPKTKQWLTIPLEARGGAESSGRSGLTLEGNRTGRRALHYKDTFFLRANGKLFLVQKDRRVKGEKAGKLRFLFLLVKRVKYPKNEWLGFSKTDLEMAADVYGRHLDTFEKKS
jgi:hypothetical protein